MYTYFVAYTYREENINKFYNDIIEFEEEIKTLDDLIKAEQIIEKAFEGFDEEISVTIINFQKL